MAEEGDRLGSLFYLINKGEDYRRIEKGIYELRVYAEKVQDAYLQNPQIYTESIRGASVVKAKRGCFLDLLLVDKRYKDIFAELLRYAKITHKEIDLEKMPGFKVKARKYKAEKGNKKNKYEKELKDEARKWGILLRRISCVTLSKLGPAAYNSSRDIVNEFLLSDSPEERQAAVCICSLNDLDYHISALKQMLESDNIHAWTDALRIINQNRHNGYNPDLNDSFVPIFIRLLDVCKSYECFVKDDKLLYEYFDTWSGMNFLPLLAEENAKESFNRYRRGPVKKQDKEWLRTEGFIKDRFKSLTNAILRVLRENYGCNEDIAVKYYKIIQDRSNVTDFIDITFVLKVAFELGKMRLDSEFEKNNGSKINLIGELLLWDALTKPRKSLEEATLLAESRLQLIKHLAHYEISSTRKFFEAALKKERRVDVEKELRVLIRSSK